MPFATSEMVPSPPQAMIRFAPCFAASAARTLACPTVSVKETENGPKCVRTSLAILGQFRSVSPASAAGLTIISGSVIRQFGVHRQIDHPSVAATLGTPVEATTALWLGVPHLSGVLHGVSFRLKAVLQTIQSGVALRLPRHSKLFAIFFAEFGDLIHQKVANLFVRSDVVLFRHEL